MPYDSIVGCCKHMWATGGFQAFWKGLVPCYLKVVPAIAVAFAVNEQLKAWFNV